MFTINCIEKTKNKEKEARMAHFLKNDLAYLNRVKEKHKNNPLPSERYVIELYQRHVLTGKA